MQPPPDILAFFKACDGDMQRFWDTCPNGDWLTWLLNKRGGLDEITARKIALAYGKKVLPIFERNRRTGDGPRRCVDAIEAFIKSPTPANRRTMKRSAKAAHAAFTAHAAAAAIYFAAYYEYPSAALEYASLFAMAASDVIKADYPFASPVDKSVREKFRKWGADTVRSIIKKTKL